MNPTLEINFWMRLFGILAVEIGFIVVIAFAAQFFLRSTVWRRMIWQVCLVCLLLLVATEITGFGRGIAVWFSGKTSVERKVSVRIVPPDEQFQVESEAPASTETPFAEAEILPTKSNVWWPGRIWAIGFALVIVRIIFSHSLLALLRRKRNQIHNPLLEKLVSEITDRLGFRGKIRLFQTRNLTSPIAFGVVRPSIGLPVNFEMQFSSAQQEAMFAHELAHLTAHDPFWYGVAEIATAIFWWHPLVWWAQRRLQTTSELAADEATAIFENGPGTLAECLVTLGKQLVNSRCYGSLGVTGFRSNLGQRVQRLLNLKEVPQPLRGWKIFLAKASCTILFAALVIFTSGWIQNGKERRENNLSAAVQKSWNGSFASITLAALAQEKAELISKKSDETIVAQPQPKPKSGSTISFATKAKVDGWDGLFGEPLFVTPRKTNKSIDLLPRPQRVFTTIDDVPEEIKAVLPAAFLRRLSTTKNADHTNVVFPSNGREEEARNALAEVQKAGESSVKPEASQRSNPAARTNLIYTSKGRREIKAKLDRIRLEEVLFESLPLGEVLKLLRAESKRRDPDEVGINFVFNPHANAPVAPTNDPNAAVWTPASSTAVDLNKITIHISPPLKDIRLADVLDAIVQVSDKPIEYKIEDYAVVFFPKSVGENVLYSRVFKLNSEKFKNELEKLFPTSAQSHSETAFKNDGAFFGNPPPSSRLDSLMGITKTNHSAEVSLKVKSFLKSIGVDFGEASVGAVSQNGKTLFFNDRTGLLMVKATLEDFDKIQPAIVPFAAEIPQVTIEAKFVEINETASRTIDWKQLLGESSAQMTTNLDSGFKLLDVLTNWVKAFPNQSLSNSIRRNFTTILTERQFKTLLEQFEKQAGTDTLSCPKVTTLSGRQVQISIRDLVKIRPSEKAPEVMLESGPILDVNPLISNDGYSIKMSVTATVSEIIEETKGILRKKISVPKIRQMSTTTNVWDGDTLVMGELIGNKSSKSKKLLFVFVTATIIDSRGNRVHTEVPPKKSN